MRKLGESYSDADRRDDNAARSRSQDAPNPSRFQSMSGFFGRDSTLPSTSRRRPERRYQRPSMQPNEANLERCTSIKDRASQLFGFGEAVGGDDVAWQRRRLRHLYLAYGIRPDEIPAPAPMNQNDRRPRSRSASTADPQTDVLGDLVENLPHANIPPRSDEARISRALSVDPSLADASDHRDSAFKIAFNAIGRLARGQTNRSIRSRPSGISRSGSFSTKRGWSFHPNPYLVSEFVSAQPQPTALGPIAETSFVNNTTTDRPRGQSDPSPSAMRSFSMKRPSITQPSPPPRTRPDRLDLDDDSDMRQSRVRFAVGRDYYQSVPSEPLSPIYDGTPSPNVDETFFLNQRSESRPMFTTDGGGTSTPPFPLVSPEGPMMPPLMPTMPIKPIQAQLKLKERAVKGILDTSTDEISWYQHWRNRFRQKVPRESLSLGTLIKRHRSRENRTGPLGEKFAILNKQLRDPSIDHRPFFTWWITTIQIIVTIMSLIHFGFGSFKFGVNHRSGDVMAASLSIAHIDVMEMSNFWLGPRYEDLIHMGAKYTPCMRRDLRIMQQIEADRRREATDTGCCWSQQLADSGTSGDCYQTSDCPTQISKQFMFANESAGIRAVCGQDPRYCRHSESWGKDISKWPPCAQPITQYSRNDVHMTCRIRGRPCCIQLHGQCRITTREYCTFVSGSYHENATLCSQVSCLSNVCGMVPFIRPEHPDQLIRLVTPIFIHAGIIQLVITVWIQMFYMVRFEAMIGTWRIVVIYFCSGVCGYLASATFVPYFPQVGPAGAHSGLLGALIVNVIYNWRLIKEPFKALLLHLFVALIMFLLGFMPYIDNVGQIVGFIVGALLAGILIPYIGVDRKVRILTFVFCLLVIVVTFVILIAFFVIKDPSQLIDIGGFTCVELMFPGICDQQSLQLRDWLPI